MQPERWEQINQLFHSALERDSSERAAFLSQACAGDDSLREEVESLIESHERPGSFIERPAGDIAADLFAESESQLTTGQSVGHYKILSLLGEGGMGEVYLAQDTRLGRQVALKRLPAQFTLDPERVRRFEQEARAASALNHPNIVTIHEVGRSNSSHFITTEFIEGETLRQHMGSASMSLDEVLDIATQVASALAAAHAAGILHRDIKPENIMLRRDRIVKVLDFGLAKLALPQAAALATGTVALQSADSQPPTKLMVKTNPGLVMGTVQYMSPEQARGQDVDARTDIWSLGVVLYEMVTGRVPFKGETPSHVIVSLIETEPPPLARYSEVPAELERIVSKALRKKKEERYQTASDLALDLKSLKQELEVEARVGRSLEQRFGVTSSDKFGVPSSAKFGVPASGGWLNRVKTAPPEGGTPNTRPTSSAEYLVTEIKRHKRGATLATAAVVIAVAAMAYFYFARNGSFATSGEAIDSVAVLPFVNVSADPNTEYLSDGISDSIINSLSRLPALRVMSLNAVLPYKGKQTDSQAVGKALNVRAVLMGRLTKQGDSLVISAELVDVRDNRRLWGEQYNRKLADIIVVQTEIAQQISDNLRLRLSAQDKKQLAKHYTESAEANQLYLKGRYHLDRRRVPDVEKAIKYYEQAVALDPNYALAHVGLAEAYSSLGDLGAVLPKDVMSKVWAETMRALQLDDTLGDAHAMLAGYEYAYEWDWSGAEKEFRHALELNPNSADSHQAFSWLLMTRGRFDEALTENRKAQELDPVSLFNSRGVGDILYFARRYDEAIAALQKTLDMDPHFGTTYHWIAESYEQKRDYEQAFAWAMKGLTVAGREPEAVAALKKAYAESGWKGYLQEDIDRTNERAKQGKIRPYRLASLYARLGDKEQAFKWLEKAYEERDIYITTLKVSPVWDAFRSDARFKDLVRRVNLEP